MTRRFDISKNSVHGTGEIRGGQASAFDYRHEGSGALLQDRDHEVVIINSNFATSKFDPGLLSKTYIESLTASVLREIIEFKSISPSEGAVREDQDR
jgi:carbamoyl-phosphate synthase large subunit